MLTSEVNNATTGNENIMPPAYSTFQHACLPLSHSDGIVVIHFPSTIINVIREAIRTGWSHGIKSEQDYGNAYEFKLIGNPWCGRGDESVDSRILMYVFLSVILSVCFIFM